MLETRIKQAIRDVPDFPKPGILFKDITPILLDHKLCVDIAENIATQVADWKVDAIVGVESRGFLFGMMVAQALKVPFIPVRKKGKLPYATVSHEYELEYGTAIVEMHTDAIKSGWNVLIHDDLLATGGTACAAAELIQKQNGTVAGFAFIVTLDFLNGKDELMKYSKNFISLVNY
ncbi:MAG: adenine phosphoribosyltransferase [Flavobacteriales bacterium]|nr:adenine phosphoribosyltransferase [Flavobacteriales bacterium]MCB9185702.1 adenine phosphoribosyltransferase [Flavobacteriales bacterium]